MTDKPMILSGLEVRAVIESRKTQFRRVLKPQPRCTDAGEWYLATSAGFQFLSDPHLTLPYAPGDRLWVRETFWHDDNGVRYRAAGHVSPFGWKPSTQMPRWASRLTLVVTDVRVQRVQDISEDDAVAEGVDKMSSFKPIQTAKHLINPPLMGPIFRVGYERLWNSMNAKRGHGWMNAKRGHGWTANPWVVAVTFEVLPVNIDKETDR